MFPEMKDLPMYLSSIKIDEELVVASIKTVERVFDVNRDGPLQ